MAGKRSPSSNWCPLRDSSDILTAVKLRKKQRGLTLVKLTEMTGIDSYRIGRYLRGVKPNITPFQLFNLCGVLGIEIDVKVKFLN